MVMAVCLVIAATRWQLSVRSVLGCLLLAILVFLGVSGVTTKYSIEGLSPSRMATVARLTQTILWIVVWICARSSPWKLGALFFVAAGLSNLLSSAYPPYHVVDYFWSAPLNRATGIGIFNLADVYWLIGLPVLGAALLCMFMPRRFQRANRAG
jgi:lipoprotein signal peptidase